MKAIKRKNKQKKTSQLHKSSLKRTPKHVREAQKAALSIEGRKMKKMKMTLKVKRKKEKTALTMISMIQSQMVKMKENLTWKLI